VADNVEIQGLEFQIVNDSNDAVKGIDALRNSLSRLKTACGNTSSSLSGTAKSIRELNNSLKNLNSGDSAQKITRMATALETLSRVSNTKISSTIAKQLTAINTAIAGIKWTDGDKLAALADGLRPFSELNRARLTSFTNQLEKLPTVIAELDKADLDKFADQLTKLTAAMKPFADEMQKVSSGFSAFPSKIQRLITSTDRYNQSANQAASSTSEFGNNLKALNIAGFALALRRVGSYISHAINESNSYQEDLNLFTAALGEYAETAEEYADTVSEIFGIDPAQWLRNQGVFNTLLTGFGDTAERAQLMSKNLTQLGYDISSFFNVSVEDSMQKLQSGISGELEPLRRLGYDLSQARLEQTALNLGIQENVSNMTQAEKAELRYYAILTQVTTAQGDMARTLEAPANQLRILQAQITQTARAIGNIFIPILNAVLPYCIAFFQVLREIANALAALMGFKLTEIDYDGVGIGNAATSAGDLADNLTDATGAAKKLQKYLAGFDELNVMSATNGSGSSGSGTNAGGVGGFDFDLPQYDFLGDAVATQVDEIKAKMKPFFDWVSKHIKGILTTIGAIGIGIAAWRIAPGVVNFFKLLGGGLGTLSKFAGVAITAAGAFIEITNAIDAFKNGLSESNLSGMLLGLIGIVGGLGIAFGPVGAAVGAATGALLIFGASIKDVMNNGFNSTNIKGIGTMGLAIVALGAAFGPVGAIIGAATAGIAALTITATSDAVPAIKLFDNTISDTTKSKVEPFINQVRELSDTLAEVKMTHTIIDDSVIADVKSKVSTISETIVNELDSDRNEALATLEPLRKALGEEAYARLMEQNTAYYDQLITSVQDKEARINEIMANAKAESRAITSDEWNEITRIQSEMQDTGIKQLSETEIEYKTIMNRLKDSATRISLEQASEIIKNAQTTREQTIADAEKQYASIELEAQRMLDVGAINHDEYDEIMAAAEKTKDETIASARSQYASILAETKSSLGENARYIDENTGEIKTKWQVWGDKLKKSWNDTWADIKWTASYDWNQIKNVWTDTWDDISTGWSNFKIWLKTSWDNFWGSLKIKLPHFKWTTTAATGWVAKTLSAIGLPTSLPKLNVEWYASGGFPDEGQLFIAREAGAEMVGSIGRKTAVANNDQIVESVSSGVYRAVRDAMGNQTGNNRTINVVAQCDGKNLFQIVVDQNGRVKRSTGKSPLAD
jgi:hypothetical protein